MNIKPFSLLSRLGERIAAAPASSDRPLFPRGCGVRCAAPTPQARGFQDVLRLPHGMWLVVSHFAVSQTQGVRVLGDDVVKFHLKTSGRTVVSVPGQLEVDLDGPSAFVMLHPAGVEKREVVLEGSQESSITVICERAGLRDFYVEDGERAPEVIDSILNSTGTGILYRDIHVTPFMAAIVRELIHSPYNGRLRGIHAEAKARELLCMMLYHLAGERAGKVDNEQLSVRDISRLTEVRAILDRRYSENLTVRALAREVGLNQKKLRLGFRQLFRETTFDYCQRMRMEHARDLLLEGHLPLSHIAEVVGYAYPSSFSVAFKRHFGILPKDMRRRTA